MKSTTTEVLEQAFAQIRSEVEDAQQKLEEQCTYAQRETLEARQALGETRDELAQTRQALEMAQSEASRMRAERDELSAQMSQRNESLQQLQNELQKQRAYSQLLREKLLELYQDLRAKDLPTLILRLAMNLVDAEVALFTDAAGTTTIAAIGLDDLSPQVSQALYRFTSEAAQEEAPVVRNDAQKLPDGRQLVNLAALPLAVKGEAAGVLLVANRRMGNFDEEQTELLLAIGRHAGIAIENHRLHEELRHAYVATVAALADAIEVKDPYTRGHCEGVAEIAVAVAEKLGWEEEQVEKMRYAALLHDIGKIGISDGVLLKPGKLLPDEFKVIQGHSKIGSDIVGHIGWLEEVRPFILHHHERMDGSGYPDGLQGENIPLGARIIGVVDALDAMTTTRPYRQPVPVEEALAELKRCSGQQFDGHIVEMVANVVHERREVELGLEVSGNGTIEADDHGTVFDSAIASKAERAQEA